MPARAFPQTPVFYRHLRRSYPRVVEGRGVYLYDDEGRRYLDGSGGALVANLGHGVAEIADAVAAQARRVAFASAAIFTSEAAEELAERLVAAMPEPLRFAYFLSSGSEAIEASVKLARQYWVERGRPGKWKVVSRNPSYHGNTLAALSLSGREPYRAPYAPLLTDFPRVPAPDSYRHPGCDACTGEAVEREILAAGPETVAAFLAEPIMGSSMGAMAPEPAHYARVAEVCRTHDVLFIADEVMAGCGRTGAWFSFEHFDALAPDVVVAGKGLSGGYAPLSAVVATRAIVETIAAGSGAFNHAQTYSHAPVACAAGAAALRYIAENRLVERSRALGPELLARLERLRSFLSVGDVRGGRGLFAAVELVADRESKRPFARTERFAERLAAHALARGLVVWPNAGHADGTNGDLVMIAPPFVVTTGELDELAELLALALGDAERETKSWEGAAR